MTPETIDITKIQFKYATLYWGTFITLICTTLFISICKYYDVNFEVRDVIAFVTCGLITTTLVYHAKNLKLNFEINKAKLDFDKKKYEEEKESKQKQNNIDKVSHSFQVSSLWFKPDMANNVELSRKFLRQHSEKLQKHKPINIFIDELENNLEERKAVICVLNYFENISLLIKNDLVDEDCIKQCFKTLFVDYLKLLRNYIDEIQKENSRFLMNYEALALKWATS